MPQGPARSWPVRSIWRWRDHPVKAAGGSPASPRGLR